MPTLLRQILFCIFRCACQLDWRFKFDRVIARSGTVLYYSKQDLIGNWPILKYLVRHQSVEVDKTDLMIFITPSIITPEI